MNHIFSILLLFISLNVFSQRIFNTSIDKQNCREGENVEYCKTHKVMHNLKANPAFLRTYLADQREL
jgi:hypothetical protein